MSNVPIVSKKRAGSKKSQSQSAGSPFPVDILPGLFHFFIYFLAGLQVFFLYKSTDLSGHIFTSMIANTFHNGCCT